MRIKLQNLIQSHMNKMLTKIEEENNSTIKSNNSQDR